MSFTLESLADQTIRTLLRGGWFGHELSVLTALSGDHFVGIKYSFGGFHSSIPVMMLNKDPS
jgi:hypothetical protein